MANSESIFPDFFRSIYEQVFSDYLLYGIGANGISWDMGVEEKPREENMTQMQPKDILVHLEKGDRTDEFVEPKQTVDSLDYAALFNDQTLQQAGLMGSQQRLVMTSARLSSMPFLRGGPTW